MTIPVPVPVLETISVPVPVFIDDDLANALTSNWTSQDNTRVENAAALKTIPTHVDVAIEVNEFDMTDELLWADLAAQWNSEKLGTDAMELVKSLETTEVDGLENLTFDDWGGDFV